MKVSRPIFAAAASVLLVLAIVAPVSATNAPSDARITVGAAGFVGNANLTPGQSLTVPLTNFPTSGNDRISIYLCESSRFVNSNGYNTSSTIDFRTACSRQASNINPGNGGTASPSILVPETFLTEVDSNPIDCRTAQYPGFSDSLQNRPGACGIFAVRQTNPGTGGAFSTTVRYYAPISFYGPYNCLGTSMTGAAGQVIGSFYNDTIDRSTATAAQTIIDPYGSNTVRGSAFNDRICTGALNDIVEGGAGNDLIDAGPGADRIAGGVFTRDGSGNVVNNSCTPPAAGSGNDTLAGGAGSDVVNGCDGTNSLLGGSGSDTLWVGTSSSGTANGGSGTDVCNSQGASGITYRNCETVN